MSNRQSPRRTAGELTTLLSSYTDIMVAQHNALRAGRVRTATTLASNADQVMAAARRADRQLTALQTLNPVDSAEWASIKRKIQTAFSQAHAANDRFGKTLADERTKLLSEIGSLVPNNSSSKPTSPPPALLNIRT